MTFLLIYTSDVENMQFNFPPVIFCPRRFGIACVKVYTRNNCDSDFGNEVEAVRAYTFVRENECAGRSRRDVWESGPGATAHIYTNTRGQSNFCKREEKNLTMTSI